MAIIKQQSQRVGMFIDKHSRRGLLQMVADRRTHLKYLEGKNKKRYNALVKKLNLKK